MAIPQYLDGWAGFPGLADLAAPLMQGQQQTAKAGFSPVNYNFGATGYNPQGSGPINNLVNQATNRYSNFLSQPSFGTGYGSEALSRGLGYAPYFSAGLPGQTITRGMSAPGYFDFGSQAGAMNFLQRNVPFAESNPYLQSYMRAANQPLVQQFQEAVLPSIGDQFSQAGMIGSTRQGVAQGIAARGLADAISRNNVTLANEGYNQGLGAMMQSLGMGANAYEGALGRQLTAGQAGAQDYESALRRQLEAYGLGSSSDSERARAELLRLSGAGSAAELGLLPSQIVGGIGAQRQQQVQRGIDDAAGRWNYYQNLPLQQLDAYARLVGGIPLGGAGQETTKMPSTLLGNISGALGSIGGILNTAGTIGRMMGYPLPF